MKRIARQGRDAFYRVLTRVERLVPGRRDPLLPPLHLRIYYYRTPDPKAFARACAGARAELVSHGLLPDHRILDIGSGIGNLAVGLTGYLRGTYEGIEIHPEAAAWCQRSITPRHPAFRFHHADVANRAYNSSGRIPAADYRFPFGEREFDFIFLGSVFTHMLPDEVDQYVREISRVLRPGGVCVASYFLLDDQARAAVDAGRSFMSFGVEHPSRLCRLHDAAKPEAAVALDERFVRRLHERAGLRIREVRRGRWWSGSADDQDVVTAVRDS